MPSARSLPALFMALSACNDQGLTTHNAEPEVTIVYPSEGEQVEEGVLLSLMGHTDDADDTPETLIASWSSASRELCVGVAVGADGETSCSVELTEDDQEITLLVQDPGGATGSDHVSITVLPSGAPVVTLDAPVASGVFYSDSLIEFAGTVSDEEDEPTDLAVGLESSLDGELDPDIDVDSDGSVSSYGLLSEGEHALSLWAEDLDGKRGSDSVVIQVGPPNTVPSCSITAPASGEVVELGETLLFEGVADDPDIPENELGVTWTSDQDGQLGTSTPSSAGDVAFSWSELSADTHVITMDVTDEVGGTCSDIIVLTVGSAPTISLTAPAFGETGDEGEDLYFEAEVFDEEDAATELSLTWESDLDGIFSTAGADSSGSVSFLYDDLSVGDHAITVEVMDSHGMTAIATTDISINGAPGAPAVSLTPDPADTEDDLSVSIDTAAADPEGDGISYAYAWYLEGVLSSASTSSTLSSSSTARGDNWTVEVTPNDGRIDGEAGTASITISNAAPSVADVAIDPSSAGV